MPMKDAYNCVYAMSMVDCVKPASKICLLTISKAIAAFFCPWEAPVATQSRSVLQPSKNIIIQVILYSFTPLSKHTLWTGHHCQLFAASLLQPRGCRSLLPSLAFIQPPQNNRNSLPPSLRSRCGTHHRYD